MYLLVVLALGNPVKTMGSPIKGQVPPKTRRAGKKKNTSPVKKV
jgi:hypothetical protein